MTADEKNETRAETQKAIARGDLVVQPCEVCGAGKVHAHHTDYTDPLAVKWLCQRHHIEEHRRLGTLGRPTLGKIGLSRGLTIKVSGDMRKQWVVEAKRMGLTLSAWLRKAADMKLEDEDREAAELAIARGASR